MEASKKAFGRRLVMVVLGQVLLLLSVSCTSAQPKVKVTADPASITDNTKPTPVVLRITKPDGSAVDATFKDQFNSILVGGQRVDPTSSDLEKGVFSIPAPANFTGVQKIEVLDKASQPLGSTELKYPDTAGARSAASPTGSPTPTPDRAEDRRDRLMNSNWYYLIVTAIFAALVIPFSYTIYRVIRFSKSSFRNPLGFPVGSFRAILAYTLVAYLGFYILTSVLSVAAFTPPDFLLGIVATVVGFYFGSRTGEEGVMDASAGIVRGIVRTGTEPARGALVKFKREDGSAPYTRITDVEGHFELLGAKPGKYTVTATPTGAAASDPVEVNVTEGSDQEIQIVLKPTGSTSTSTTTSTTTTPPPAQTGIITGTVTRAADNTPVEKATVSLTQGGADKGKTTTDAAGKYTIPKVAFGDYQIVASLGATSSGPKPVKVAAAPVSVDLQI